VAKDEQVRIDLVAEDHASKTIEDVADEVADLERADAEVTITAEDDASSKIADVADDARALSAVDAELVLRARVDAAKGELAALRADLQQTGERAEDTARQLDRVGGDPGGGIKTRGNAVADLTGPLGDASGAASNFAGVFDGLGDVAEDVATKLGASSALAGQVAGAVGGLGIVVAAGAAVWSLFSASQKKAREEAEKLVKTQDDLYAAIKKNDAAAATKAFHDLFADAERAAKEAGIPVQEYTDFILGLSDEMPTAKARQDELTAAFLASGPAAKGAGADAALAAADYREHVAAVEEARAKHAETNLTLAESKAADDALTTALGLTEDAAKGAAEEVEHVATASERAETRQKGLRTAVENTETAFRNLRGSLDLEGAEIALRDKIEAALLKVSEGADLSAEDILGIKQSLIDVGEFAGTNPVEVATTVNDVSQDDLLGILAAAQRWADENPVEILTRIVPPRITPGSRGGTGITPEIPFPFPGSATTEVVNVYQTIPRGYRGDALADARAAARRSGRLYRRAG
jgi:hypothetical protein